MITEAVETWEQEKARFISEWWTYNKAKGPGRMGQRKERGTSIAIQGFQEGFIGVFLPLKQGCPTCGPWATCSPGWL